LKCVVLRCFGKFLYNPYYELLPWFMIMISRVNNSTAGVLIKEIWYFKDLEIFEIYINFLTDLKIIQRVGNQHKPQIFQDFKILKI